MLINVVIVIRKENTSRLDVARTCELQLEANTFLLSAIRESGSFSVVTAAPNAGVAPLHDRMPPRSDQESRASGLARTSRAWQTAAKLN